MRLHLPAVLAAAVGAPLMALANNGFNLIGFGTESIAMGGADTAVARDTSALNTNPAGLGQLSRPAFDGYAGAAFLLDTGHVDGLGNNRRVDNKVIPVAGFGASRPFAQGNVVAAIGLFAQGGSGAVYKDLQTPFGSRDELSALVGFVRITPGFAWKASERLTIGVAAPLNVVLAKQKLFPATSIFNPTDPAQTFFGIKLDGARGVRLGLRLGAQWKPSDALTLGAAFQPKTTLEAKHGKADVNMSAIGLGTVRYRDARIDGFALPREVSVGAAWQATASTLFAVKVSHLAWSAAIRTLTVSLSDPVDLSAPPVLTQTSRLDWHDQTVFALGASHRLAESMTLYAGFNYARSPVRRETMTPLLALISERHFTGGLAIKMTGGWAAVGALEYVPHTRFAYDNSNFPLGQGAKERLSYVATNLMISRRW